MTAGRALLTGLIDYAGLFPPAGLSMAEAVQRFAVYRQGPDAWLLGRFILPASRLGEYHACRTARGRVDTWPLTVLIGPNTVADFRAVARVHEAHRVDGGPGSVAACDVKAETAAAIRQARTLAPPQASLAFELPTQGDTLAELLPAVKDVGGAAKIRTGGLVPAAVPSAGAVASFIWACASAQVPFKATAGLHRAIRGQRALTYAPDSPVAVLHGFLNLFLAAAAARALSRAGTDAGRAVAELEAILSRDAADPFTVTDESVRRGADAWSTEVLSDLRASVALSFGSCSFEEPVEDLRALGFLTTQS